MTWYYLLSLLFWSVFDDFSWKKMLCKCVKNDNHRSLYENVEKAFAGFFSYGIGSQTIVSCHMIFTFFTISALRRGHSLTLI